jgi:uncharacterized protein
VTLLIGVVHLPALPGSPRSSLSMRDCIRHAVRDARALSDGGADAIIVENFHDVPFRPGAVDAHTIAAMTVACLAIRDAVTCAIGVNVLRNDAAAALGIAMACEASFIRINVHTGAMLTDQGIVTGKADETLRLRRSLGAEGIRIYADVLVKHAVPIGAVSLRDAVRDSVERGLADAVIVTGGATGAAATREDVVVAASATSVPVLVGSGVSAVNAGKFIPPAAGVIVGSSLKSSDDLASPVEIERVKHLRAVLDAMA